jgi:Flp pilus assembly protein TadB
VAGVSTIALDASTMRDVALGVVVAALLLAVVLAVVIRWIVAKVVAIVVLAVVAGLVWWQRGNLQDCADRVGRTLGAGATDTTTCTFFGRDVSVDSPLG